MASNTERTCVRDMWLSSLMRKVPAPAGHIDVDGLQLTESELLAWMDGVNRLCECHTYAPLSPLRYPGAKGRLAKWILRQIPIVDSLCEPFAGTAAVTLAAIEHGWPLRRIWINDAHPGVAALWKTIRDCPNQLISWSRSFRPMTAADWDDYMAMPRESPLRLVALHAMSFGGLGEKAGGPIGGKSQSSKYTIGCRWSPDRFAAAVEKWSPLLAGAKITCLDAGGVIEDAANGGWYCYIDPPYVSVGRQMYSEAFNHTRLRGLPGQWLMSMDDGDWICGMGTVVSRKQAKTTIGATYFEVLIKPGDTL
ncbi:MAG: DNA adenine methylase [Nitrososphaera sp.]